MTRSARGAGSLLPPSLPPIGISRLQAAEFIGVSPSNFDQMVVAGTMPSPRRVGRRAIWDVAQVVLAFRALPQDSGARRRRPVSGDEVYERAFGSKPEGRDG